AAALARVLEDDALAKRMGRASRRRFEEGFGLRRMVDETVALYDRTVAPRGESPAAGLSWETVTHLDRLAALADEWRALLSPRGFFVGPEWVLAWLHTAGSAARPHALVAREPDGRLAGLLPLARAGWGALEVAGARAGADHVDVVAASGREQAVAEGALDRLESARWRVVRLRHLSEDGALRLAIRRRGWRLPYAEALATTCPYVSTAGGFNAYLARFSAKHRGNLRRAAKAFRAASGAEVA